MLYLNYVTNLCAFTLLCLCVIEANGLHYNIFAYERYNGKIQERQVQTLIDEFTATDIPIETDTNTKSTTAFVSKSRVKTLAVQQTTPISASSRTSNSSNYKIDSITPSTSDPKVTLDLDPKDGICQFTNRRKRPIQLSISIGLDRKIATTESITTWNFSAHNFTNDELLYAALVMLEHTLKMPELEPWRMSTESLTGFLLASRSAYNAFVPYHNFRHAVDTLQACFIFLIRLGRIPSFPDMKIELSSQSSTLAETIRPYDALTLLITAIGHDIGHPGVNNAFLTTLNAPLAQLYNNRSVLESFHSVAFSQMLRCHWPSVFQTKEMRQLMVNTILATDKDLHSEYVKKLARINENIISANTSANNSAQLSPGELRTFACALIMKCADISNVARNFEIASLWAVILTDEFSRRVAMGKEMGISSALLAPPIREIAALGKSQIDFIETYAYPLFDGIAEVMPALSFCVEELMRNKLIWKKLIIEN
ncbi:3',5'-cyclic-nucleotide phosphodiesterase 2 [Erysiphe necator]|uniref:Phosphodiesterase n=1 Tax=Uncinula necator TaxID=52586 RepID=A0A0B1PA16_UNCNE|nr:3',5'-cyclic-nucleotide phosphodiesterase 2 [Erysiphe necator]KHJ33771.1 putative camp-specific 3 -cyclic phosphodiesterase 7b [Erysiphe necator]